MGEKRKKGLKNLKLTNFSCHFIVSVRLFKIFFCSAASYFHYILVTDSPFCGCESDEWMSVRALFLRGEGVCWMPRRRKQRVDESAILAVVIALRGKPDDFSVKVTGFYPFFSVPFAWTPKIVYRYPRFRYFSWKVVYQYIFVSFCPNICFL